MKWFRFHSEAIYDRKLSRVAKMSGCSMAEAIGVWTILLSLASESPERGYLYIAEDIPATDEDISDIAECNVSVTLRNMLHVTLVKQDETGLYSIVNWSKRQYESDNSTTRVQKHRFEKKNKVKSDNCNVSVTPMKRYSNAPDTETETETDTDTEVVAATSARPLLAVYQEMAGETGNPPAKFRTWFADVTGRYGRNDCIAAFAKMRDEMNGGTLNGASKWDRTRWHLEHPFGNEPPGKVSAEDMVGGLYDSPLGKVLR